MTPIVLDLQAVLEDFFRVSGGGRKTLQEGIFFFQVADPPFVEPTRSAITQVGDHCAHIERVDM